ncbi:hypothetical protein [Poseidonibacter sp.]|uniref:hypothetical protein n=1 Tax=Poseidonibacter sp. TaxID=2321188 RepID=UPI003C7764F3
MTDREIEVRLGIKINRIAVIKFNNIKKYNLIFSFDKDRLKSVIKFNKYIEDLHNKVIDIYYSFKCPWQFAKWLKDNGIYKHNNPTSSEVVIFKNNLKDLSITLEVINKLENIILLYYAKEINEMGR